MKKEHTEPLGTVRAAQCALVVPSSVTVKVCYQEAPTVRTAVYDFDRCSTALDGLAPKREQRMTTDVSYHATQDSLQPHHETNQA
jgi:hypothetical protein